MSEMDVLFPLPDGRRNADDMGMPPEQAMSDDERHRDELLAENERLQTQVQGYREDVTREVEANYVTIQTVYKLRALLLKSYCYVAAHVPIGVKTDNDRKVLMLDIDAALAGGEDMSATDIVINGLEARIRELEAAYAAKMNETRYVAAERDALRTAMVHVRAHTGTLPNATLELTLGLLASIERIADAALAEKP